MWRNNIKLAFRSLISNKLFTTINLLGLSIGMAAALLIFIWVQNELSFDRHYPNANNTYRVLCQWYGEGQVINIDAIPIALKEVAQEEIPEIEEFYLLQPAYWKPLLRLEQEKVFEEKELAYVNENWLEGFDYQIVEGSIEAFNQDKYSMALTKSQAIKYFGNLPALGQTVYMDSLSFTVRLILEDNPSYSSFQFKTFLPLKAYWADQEAYEKDYNSGNYHFIAFLRSHKDADKREIADKLGQILTKNEGEEDIKTCSLVHLPELRFNQDLKSDYFKHQKKSTVYIFGFIALLLLLVAGLNYVNLSTAQISKKTKDIGVRKIIGASFRHIFSQAMLETFLLSVCAFILALGITELCLPILGQFMEISLKLELNRPHLWLIFIGVLSLNVLVAGIYPALLLGRFKPVRLIKHIGRSEKGVSLRKVLVVVQFVTATIVLISTVVIYQQLRFIQHKDVGYDRSYVVNINPNLNRGDSIQRNYDRYTLFAEELKNIPDFEAVAVVESPIINITSQNRGSFAWEGKPADYSVIVSQLGADENLMSVFNLQMLQGRWFLPELESDQNNFIVNETAIKQFNIQEPVIGKRASFGRLEGQIIGVVKDFHFSNFRRAIDPLIIRHNRSRGRSILAKIHAKSASTALVKAEGLFKAHLPGLMFEYNFLDDTFEQMHKADTKLGSLFQIFASLLIFIACLGLLGLALFAAERRTKEIGIRKVLGATVTNIVTLLSKDFLKLVMIALVIASPIAWYAMQRWLQSFAYHIDIQWWMFALASIIAIGIAFLTISFQSIRAALANPVDALRSE